ncbi:MAG: cellulose binding domain-containing protein, partial [Cyanobacteria bacterium J06626_14]
MNMLNFSIVNDWNHGFTGSLSITNPGTTAIDGWTIEFEAPFEITNLWNGEIVSRNGNRYVIRNAAWNSTIQPDETISFGFNGKNSNGMTIEPTNYRLNGTDVQVGAPQPISPAPTPEPLPELSIANTTVTEGGDNQAQFLVNLSTPSTDPITVEYSTAADTAQSGTDYQQKSGTLTFNPGEVSKTVTVNVLDDQAVEQSEQFALNLSRATNARLGTATGIATIA